jgi:uncharacterized C2H2 Zn-finger protein
MIEEICAIVMSIIIFILCVLLLLVMFVDVVSQGFDPQYIKCPYCGYLFKHDMKLTDHINTELRYIKCEECDGTISTYTDKKGVKHYAKTTADDGYYDKDDNRDISI